MEVLNELDYPDALTGGLRRYADNARALIEGTRSDITNAVVNDSLRRDLSKLKKMNYKYISGEVPLPRRYSWCDGMKLQDIYPNSSFVSGTENPEGMRIHPVAENNMVQINYTFEERFAGGPGLVHGGILQRR